LLVNTNKVKEDERTRPDLEDGLIFVVGKKETQLKLALNSFFTTNRYLPTPSSIVINKTFALKQETAAFRYGTVTYL
jgi:hypothetical protein